MEYVPTLFTLEGVAAAWTLHSLVSIFFGLHFVGLVTIGPLPAYASRVAIGAGLGIAYGFGVWIGGGVISMLDWWRRYQHASVVACRHIDTPSDTESELAGPRLSVGLRRDPGALYQVLLPNN